MSQIQQEFIPGNATAKLRDDLHKEEIDEIGEALEEGDKAQLLKEICDGLYVLFGTAVTYNLPIEQAFLETHKDNMAKLAQGTANKKGKFVKPAGWKKLNLQHLLDMQKEISKEKQDLEFVFFE